ncbi:hypothetical protein GCM10027289_23700 [Tsukamurella serpentis]
MLVSVMDLATAERRSLLELVQDFTQEQWGAASPCAGRRVRGFDWSRTTWTGASAPVRR